jgi:hypothetical protein
MKTGTPYFIIDAPGITGNTPQLMARTAPGGAEGFLEPGRGLEGKKGRLDGTVVG